MRTLKKTLCLVLALVMMLGVCAFGTSAAFTDEAQITYKEAVAVLTGIGVINGMGNGTFAPNGTLTRAQACTIVTKLMGGDGIIAKSTFTDMDSASWAESYVAFCQAKGIVGGYGDGRFGPNDTLTGSQWGRMLLLAAGFDAAANGFESGNANWEIGVAKTVKDKGLAARITGFNGTQPISRDAACEMAFKALDVGVSGQKVYTVTTLPGQTFESWLEAFIASGSVAANVRSASPVDSLKSQNFPTLTSAGDADAAGRPAEVWTLNGKVIATVPTPAAYTTTTAVRTADLNKGLKAAKVLSTGDTEYTDETNPTRNGVKVEWFDKDTVITTETKLATVTNVRSIAANRQHGAYVEYSYKIGTASATSGKVYSTVVNEDTDLDTVIIEGTIAKGDTVLVVGAAGELPTLKVAKTVSGVLSNVRGNVLTVGGKSYTVSGTAGTTVVASAETPDATKTVAYYVDEYGFIMAAVENESSDPEDVYGILLSVKQTWALNAGALEDSYTAKFAGEDGKVADYAITASEYAELNAATLPAVATVEDDLDEDGTKLGSDFTVKANNVAEAYNAKTGTTINGKLIGSGTLFIYADKDAKGNVTGTVTVLAQGNQKSFKANAAYVLTDKADRIATVVFVTGELDVAVATDNYVYYLGTYSRTGANAYDIDVILKGVETTMTVKALPANGAGFYKSLNTNGVGDLVASGDKAGYKLENVAGTVWINDVHKTDLKAKDETPIYVIDVTGGVISAGPTMAFSDVKAGFGDANDSLYVATDGNGNVLAFYFLQDTDDVG